MLCRENREGENANKEAVEIRSYKIKNLAGERRLEVQDLGSDEEKVIVRSTVGT